MNRRGTHDTTWAMILTSSLVRAALTSLQVTAGPKTPDEFLHSKVTGSPAENAAQQSYP